MTKSLEIFALSEPQSCTRLTDVFEGLLKFNFVTVFQILAPRVFETKTFGHLAMLQ